MTPDEILVDMALRFYRKVLADAAMYVPMGTSAEDAVLDDRASCKRLIKLNTKGALLR